VIRKIVATKIFMKIVCPGLRLVVQLVQSTERFGIWAHPLALESPDEDAKSYNGIRGQLMKINFEIFQDFPYHLVQRKSQSCSEEALKKHYFIILRCWGGLFSGKSDKFPFSFPKVAQLHHHGHISFSHSRFLKIEMAGFCWDQNIIIFLIHFNIFFLNNGLFSFGNNSTFISISHYHN
jgi:hypothetical protein